LKRLLSKVTITPVCEKILNFRKAKLLKTVSKCREQF